MIVDVKALESVRKEGDSLSVTFSISNAYKDNMAALATDLADGKELTLEVKRKRKSKRSLNANAYMWVLCQKLGKVMTVPKEEVYRRAVHDVGAFQLVSVCPTAAERTKQIWEARGIGWICEKITNTDLFLYYGSSIYDKAEMARLIDWLLNECRELKIPTVTDKEISEMIGRWGT